MSAQDMTTAELLVAGRGLQGNAAILHAYPLTAAFPAVIDVGVQALVAVEDGLNPGPVSRGALLRAADQGVDRPLSLFNRAIDWLEVAFPAEQDLWTRVRLHVLPKGLRAVVQSSYPNEVGEMQRLEARLDEALVRDLAGIRLHTRTALDFVRDAIAGGRALDEVINAPDAPPPAESETERQVKARFIQLVQALRSTARTAQWSEAHLEAVFDPIDKAIAEATKRADAERRVRLADAEKKVRSGTGSVEGAND